MPFIYTKVLKEVPILTDIICNRCLSKIEGSYATLSLSTADSEDISVYCIECYNLIISGDRIQADTKDIMEF